LPSTLVCEQRGPIAIVRISRVSKRNAIDDDTMSGIEAFFSNLPDGTRVAVLHGEGPHFCAGLDLSTAREDSAVAGMRRSRSWHRAVEQIENGAVPVIAVLHGAVIGGGLELASAAHIRVAEKSAFYALPEGSRGLLVGGGGSVRIPRLIGIARMMDMMLTGRTYGAAQGLDLGFSQYLVPDGDGLSKAIELANWIAANASLSNFAVIQALPRIARAAPETGLLLESLMVALAISDPEAETRLQAFFEKRVPKVSHRPDDEGEQTIAPRARSKDDA
jgi:enoyl-CoA hydratase/carnithine racemase